MTTQFIEGRCYFTPESIVQLCDDMGSKDEALIGFDRMHGIEALAGHVEYAWVPRYVVAALIFGEE